MVLAVALLTTCSIPIVCEAQQQELTTNFEGTKIVDLNQVKLREAKERTRHQFQCGFRERSAT